MTIKDISSAEFKLLASKATPKWESIRRQIRQQVLGGDFVPGDVLPTETSLCGQFRTARNTVRQALDELEKEGLVYRIQGKGTFVAHAKPTGRNNLGTQNVFCLITPQVGRDLFPAIINGFSEGALQISRRVMLVTTNNDIYRQGGVMLQILDSKMAGVALVPMLEKVTPAHHIQQLQANGIPVVLCNRPVEGVSAPLVIWDWEEMGRIAARHFLGKGHRKIGYYGYVRHAMNEAHARGMQEILVEAGYAMHPQNMIFSSFCHTDEVRKDMVEKMLSGPECPTAILCNDDTEAENLYWFADELGLKVPDDLAIIGFGIPDRIGMFRKKLTSITMNGLEVGQKAVELLAEMQAGARSITSGDVFHVELGFAPGSTA